MALFRLDLFKLCFVYLLSQRLCKAHLHIEKDVLYRKFVFMNHLKPAFLRPEISLRESIQPSAPSISPNPNSDNILSNLQVMLNTNN